MKRARPRDREASARRVPHARSDARGTANPRPAAHLDRCWTCYRPTTRNKAHRDTGVPMHRPRVNKEQNVAVNEFHACHECANRYTTPGPTLRNHGTRAQKPRHPHHVAPRARCVPQSHHATRQVRPDNTARPRANVICKHHKRRKRQNKPARPTHRTPPPSPPTHTHTHTPRAKQTPTRQHHG